MKPSDGMSKSEQPIDGECCGAHEVICGAGRPCSGCNWRCVLREIIDKFLKDDQQAREGGAGSL